MTIITLIRKTPLSDRQFSSEASAQFGNTNESGWQVGLLDEREEYMIRDRDADKIWKKL